MLVLRTLRRNQEVAYVGEARRAGCRIVSWAAFIGVVLTAFMLLAISGAQAFPDRDDNASVVTQAPRQITVQVAGAAPSVAKLAINGASGCYGLGAVAGHGVACGGTHTGCSAVNMANWVPGYDGRQAAAISRSQTHQPLAEFDTEFRPPRLSLR